MNTTVEAPQKRETEVVAKAKRRSFTAEQKQRVLNEVDQASASRVAGAVGAILRREGIYSSHLAAWRRAREAGDLSALTPKRRGPAPKRRDENDVEKAELRKKLAISEARLKRAEGLLALQKKVAELLGEDLPKSGDEP